MAFHRVDGDIHEGASYLNNAGLVWLQNKTVLDLNECAKLGQHIDNREFVLAE